MKKPDLLDLRPCQFVLGMKEVEAKIAKMSGMGKKELRAYCDDHAIPVVIGPRDEMYVIDHHHFARACWEMKIDGYVIKVVENLSDYSESDFWNFMVKKDWMYLNDQFGMGPHSPASLPVDIRCLSDDPYRSLVWAMIDAGAIRKVEVPFFEFKWCAFFRLNLDVRLNAKSDFKRAIEMARKLAVSSGANHLPGWVSEKTAKGTKKGSGKKH